MFFLDQAVNRFNKTVRTACLSVSTKKCSLLVPSRSGHPVLLQCLSIPHWMLVELAVVGAWFGAVLRVILWQDEALIGNMTH